MLKQEQSPQSLVDQVLLEPPQQEGWSTLTRCDQRREWEIYFREKARRAYQALLTSEKGCKHSKVVLHHPSQVAIEGRIHHYQCTGCCEQEWVTVCFCEAAECSDRGFCKHNIEPGWVTAAREEKRLVKSDTTSPLAVVALPEPEERESFKPRNRVNVFSVL